MPRIDHDMLAALFAAADARPDRAFGATTESLARTEAFQLHAVSDRQLDLEEKGSAAGPPALARVSSASRDYLRAHVEVLRLEVTFVETRPDLRDQLLGVDHAYQRAWADLRGQKRRVPAQFALSGPHSVDSSLAALRGLLAELQADRAGRSAARHLVGPLAEAQHWVEIAAHRELEAEIMLAREARARALGPAMETIQLELNALFAPQAPAAWERSVVRVQREGAGTGSGVFIASDRILTAAHVVAPEGMGPPRARDLSVFGPSLGRRLNVARVRVHPRWTSDTDFSADYALLDLAPVSGLGLAVRHDFGASGDSFDVRRYGYPTDGGSKAGSGTIDFAGDMFESADLEVPSGASGGALVYSPDGNPVLVGITTFWSPPPPGGKSAIGLPIPSGLEQQMSNPAASG